VLKLIDSPITLSANKVTENAARKSARFPYTKRGWFLPIINSNLNQYNL